MARTDFVEVVNVYRVVTTTSSFPWKFNAILLYNDGTSTCTINNAFTLDPGESLRISHNAGEINVTDMQIQFSSDTDNVLMVVMTMYKDNY